MITSPADTLVCDTTQLAVWQSDPAYDYGRELMAPDINVFEWFNRWFGKILQKIFGSHFAEEYSELILIGIAILLLILIIWFVSTSANTAIVPLPGNHYAKARQQYLAQSQLHKWCLLPLHKAKHFYGKS